MSVAGSTSAVRSARVSHGRRAALFCALLAPAFVVHAGDHPRFLLPGQLQRIRHTCGVGAPSESAGDWGRFGANAAAYAALRQYFADAGHGQSKGEHSSEFLSGEILAAAFLHAVNPSDAGDDRRMSLIRGALAHLGTGAERDLESVVALDWCWESLPAAARADAIAALRERAKPLQAQDSPLERGVFFERLLGLTAATLFDEDDGGEAWGETRRALLAAARDWYKETLPHYLEWRGLTPTMPSSAGAETIAAVLVAEVGNLLVGDTWERLSGTLARYCEPFVFETAPHPASLGLFVRDVPGAGTAMPVGDWSALQPLAAHLLALRTRDPSATLVADRVARELNSPTDDGRRLLWRWVPIVCDLRGLPRCDEARLPAARNLAGSIVFRGGSGGDTAIVRVDAAQPALHAQQHLDAGSFLMRRGGDLLVSAADESSAFVTRERGGSEGLGASREPFEFAQFNVSSIAHNTMIFYDPARVSRWFGKLFAPIGGQTPHDGGCRDFRTSLAEQGRSTGTLRAFQTSDVVSYAALDLAPAYDVRTLTSYVREFLWFADGATLVVIDRVRTIDARVPHTFIATLPACPAVDGAALSDDRRVAGATGAGGVWRYDAARRLRVESADGGMWIVPLLPEARRLSVVGGPARAAVDNQRAGTPALLAADPDGFERLIIPSSRPKPRNAWFRLGAESAGASATARTPLWGRIEIEPQGATAESTLISAFVLTGRRDAAAPAVNLHTLDDRWVIELFDPATTIEVFRDPGLGAAARVRTAQGRSAECRPVIEADRPLLTRE